MVSARSSRIERATRSASSTTPFLGFTHAAPGKAVFATVVLILEALGHNMCRALSVHRCATIASRDSPSSPPRSAANIPAGVTLWPTGSSAWTDRKPPPPPQRPKPEQQQRPPPYPMKHSSSTCSGRKGGSSTPTLRTWRLTHRSTLSCGDRGGSSSSSSSARPACHRARMELRRRRLRRTRTALVLQYSPHAAPAMHLMWRWRAVGQVACQRQ